MILYAHSLSGDADPLVVLGVRVPPVFGLPFALDRPLFADGLRISRAGGDSHDLPQAPRALHDWLAPRVLASNRLTGKVSPLPSSFPAYQAVFTAAKADLARRGGKPATGQSKLTADHRGTFDQRDISFMMLRELVCRGYALDPDDATALLAPYSPFATPPTAELIAATYREGFLAPGSLAQEVIEASDKTARAKRLAEAAKARAVAAASERKPRHGLMQLTRTGRARDDDRHSLERALAAEAPIPMGVSYVHLGGLPGWDGELALGLHGKTGVFDLTDSEYAHVAPLGGLAMAIEHRRDEANEGRRYTEQDFTGDARTIQGRYDLERFAAHASLLVRTAQTSGQGGPSQFAERCLWTLPVAFGGAVDLQNAADAIIDALAEYVARQRGGSWQGIRAARDIPRLMLAALAEGSPWQWGELATNDVPAKDATRLERLLDPDLFKNTILASIEGLTQVPSSAVAAALHVKGLIATLAPSHEDRGRIRAVLEAHGWALVEVNDKQLGRRKMWILAAPAPDAMVTT